MNKQTTAPFRDPPTVEKCINREFFRRLGTYDPDFDIWGGENLELYAVRYEPILFPCHGERGAQYWKYDQSTGLVVIGVGGHCLDLNPGQDRLEMEQCRESRGRSGYCRSTTRPDWSITWFE